ncbi:uncharacterized protein LOC142363236 isoform X3 [Opisthocomus hoazin]|uniref:uncharacterized protein LOC142363236 isoform X3 n=1 Tax=Opisthocomus hoazin TaxID=30419 RepID=UPI003F530654
MSPAGPLPTPGSLTTACPCGDPADFACKNAELIAATRTTTMGKDFPGRGAAPEHHVSSDQAAQPPELVCPARTKATPSPAPGALRRRTAPPGHPWGLGDQSLTLLGRATSLWALSD